MSIADGPYCNFLFILSETSPSAPSQCKSYRRKFRIWTNEVSVLNTDEKHKLKIHNVHDVGYLFLFMLLTMIKVKNRHIKCPSKTFYWIHYPEWLRKSKYIQSIQHAHPWKILEVAMFQPKSLYFMLNSLLQWDRVDFLMLIKACCCYLNKDAVWIRYTVCKISRNNGWSNGPMATLWVVRWRYKLILSYCIIDTWISRCISFVDYTLLCWKQNKKHHGKLWYPFVTKNLGRPTDHLGGPLGRLDDL